MRERERERERLCPSVKWWKHRNCTICIIQDLHISLSIGDCIEWEREQERVRERVTEEREREIESKRERARGGTSDSLSRYFIWKFELTSHLGNFISQLLGEVYLTDYLFLMGSHWQHRTVKSSSPITDSFVWGVYLTDYLFQMGSHWQHRTAKSSSPITDSFVWGDISENVVWKFALISGLTLASQKAFLRKTKRFLKRFFVTHLELYISYYILPETNFLKIYNCKRVTRFFLFK